MLAENLKYLRRKHKISQQDLANQLKAARTTLGDYERGKTEPNISTLIKLSEIFDIKVDALLRSNLQHADLEVIRNKDFRVLAISVDKENNGNIELVDSKAEAGYLESFQDPEYIRDLPKIFFPNIPQGTFRGFEIQGESMLPIETGSIIIASYIENLKQLKNEKTYIIVTKYDGLVYKRVRINKKEKKVMLFSDNEAFLPYEIDFGDISEVWQYYAHLSFSDRKKTLENRIDQKLTEIQQKVTYLHDNWGNSN